MDRMNFTKKHMQQIKQTNKTCPDWLTKLEKRNSELYVGVGEHQFSNHYPTAIGRKTQEVMTKSCN
jgi:hypothetical protein